MSASVTSNTTDLAEKFQRLSREYHKVKEMCKVLSAGVNSERAKSEKLEHNLKDKEAQYRKLVSEKEAIEFHNNQLTKRIELLREELDKKPPISKKKKLKPNEVDVDGLYNRIKLLEDELCNKLHTNEALTNQISDLEEREAQLTADLEKQKGIVEEIKFAYKMAPVLKEVAACQASGLTFEDSFNATHMKYDPFSSPKKSNGMRHEIINPFSEEETAIVPPKLEFPKVPKVDAEIQVDIELNNNRPSSEAEKAELEAKQEEISRLSQSIRKLEDLKEKQSLDITLLKKRLELAGSESLGMDSAEQATRLARARIREVMNQKEDVENTARFYMKEVKNLQMNMRDVLESKIYLQNRIKELETSNGKISDELLSVRNSYDAQLSQMSEMVIELNKKLQTADTPPKQEPIAPTRTLRSLFGK